MQMRLWKWVYRVRPPHVHPDCVSQEGPGDRALHVVLRNAHEENPSLSEKHHRKRPGTEVKILLRKWAP